MSWSNEKMCQLAAELLIKPGMYVNLGIGIPTLVANYIDESQNITLHSENGMLGMGPFPTRDQADPDLINAGKQTITELPHSCYFDSASSFAMIRGGHIDVSILGALQVAENGDLANWQIPGKMVKGMGGAMDLVAGANHVAVIMEHNTKDGAAKFMKECDLPLTGEKVVDHLITNLGIFEFCKEGVLLTHIAAGSSIEEIRVRTNAQFSASPNLITV